MDGLNNRNLFLIILEVRKSKVKVLANLDAGEGQHPDRDGCILALSLHGRERERTLLLHLLIRAPITSQDLHSQDLIWT